MRWIASRRSSSSRDALGSGGGIAALASVPFTFAAPRASATTVPLSPADSTCPDATACSPPSLPANSTLPSYTLTTRTAPIAAPATPCLVIFFIGFSSTRKQVPVTRTVPCAVSTSKRPPRSTR